MDYDEILKILGKPDNCESVLNMKSCRWEESSKNITIKLFQTKWFFYPAMGFKNRFGRFELAK